MCAYFGEGWEVLGFLKWVVGLGGVPIALACKIQPSDGLSDPSSSMGILSCLPLQPSGLPRAGPLAPNCHLYWPHCAFHVLRRSSSVCAQDAINLGKHKSPRVWWAFCPNASL